MRESVGKVTIYKGRELSGVGVQCIWWGGGSVCKGGELSEWGGRYYTRWKGVTMYKGGEFSGGGGLQYTVEGVHNVQGKRVE